MDRKCLARRLKTWEKGHIEDLLEEAVEIQKRLDSSKKAPSKESVTRMFTRWVIDGQSRRAMRLLSDNSKGGILPLTEETIALIRAKHPDGKEAELSSLLTGEIPKDVNKVVWEKLTAEVFKSCTLRTTGACGPSLATDKLWRRMVTSYGSASSNLCHAGADFTRRFATEFLDPAMLAPLLASRGIALDKNPGLRPICIGEVLRRIMGKCIMQIVGQDVQAAVGTSQFCGGQAAGVEAAIHKIRSLFENDDCHAALLSDADSAFQLVNRKAGLWNVQYICPAIKYAIINTYREPTSIFFPGHEDTSKEGTSQGDSLAMAMYALILMPLLHQISGHCNQAWYADDGTGADTLDRLRNWWDALIELGPSFGYFPNPAKTYLIVKPDKLADAHEIFEGTNIQITVDGERHLGAVIGSEDFKFKYVSSKVAGWVDMVHRLSDIAITEPHAAYSVFVHQLQHSWQFTLRTISGLSDAFQPIEDAIRNKFLPALLGRAVSDWERELFSFPARLGGLDILDPTSFCQSKFEHSVEFVAPLLKVPCNADFVPKEIAQEQKEIRKEQRLFNDGMIKARLENLKTDLQKANQDDLLRAITLAQQKGASIWLTAIPSKFHGTHLNKESFRDSINIRYLQTPSNLPTKCGCGEHFDLSHAMTCLYGGFRHLLHNNLNDLLFDVCKEAGFKHVIKEPALLPLEGEEFAYKSANHDNGARSDLKVLSLYVPMRQHFLDATAWSPLAKSNSGTPESVYKKIEMKKERQYKERIQQVDHGDFTPLVFCISGGMGPKAASVIRHLAEALAIKQDQPLSSTLCWLRCRISFTLLRSAMLLLRGSRPPRRTTVDFNIERAVVEMDIER